MRRATRRRSPPLPYAPRPSSPELLSVRVIQRHFELVDGQRTGDYTDRVTVEYDLEDGR